VFSGFEDAERVEVPDTGSLLPKEIGGFTRAGVYDEEHEHTSFIQGGGMAARIHIWCTSS
jgi:hypothetical protein